MTPNERPAGPDARPRVGISRCLLGDNVRYDGGHKLDAFVLELAPHVEWVPVCPEVEAGMGTPREPIQLVRVPGAADVRLLGVTSGADWTSRMGEWSRGRVRELAAGRLAGFVLKKNSPSCGPSGVSVWTSGQNSPIGQARGRFAEELVRALPALPIADEEQLHDDTFRGEFLARVREYHATVNGSA